MKVLLFFQVTDVCVLWLLSIKLCYMCMLLFSLWNLRESYAVMLIAFQELLFIESQLVFKKLNDINTIFLTTNVSWLVFLQVGKGSWKQNQVCKLHIWVDWKNLKPLRYIACCRKKILALHYVLPGSRCAL